MNHIKSAIHEQENLIYELENIYALIESSHIVLDHHNVLELDSTQKVLALAYDKTYEVIKEENEKLEALKVRCNHELF